MVKKIKKVQKEGKSPKSTNYHFTINNKKPILPVQTILLTDLVSCFLFQLFFTFRKLDLRLCFYRRVNFKQLFCNGSPFFLDKNAIPYPLPLWGPQY